MPKYELSIEQDDCTSCGLCEEMAPRHFFMGPDGLAYVKEDGAASEVKFRGFQGKVAVTAELENIVFETAEECPGECIYVEEAGNQALSA